MQPGDEVSTSAKFLRELMTYGVVGVTSRWANKRYRIAVEATLQQHLTEACSSDA